MKAIRGSLTIEASLCLPIFLLVIFSILYLIKIAYIHEQVQYAIDSAANEMAINAYMLDKTGLVDLQQKTYNQANQNIEEVNDKYDQIDEVLDGLIDFHSYSEPINESLREDEAIGSEPTTTMDNISSDLSSLYQVGVNLIEFIQYIVEDSKTILCSLGASKGIEIVNQAIGTKITQELVDTYITEVHYENWGIINGSKGMNYSGSSFLLDNEDILISVQYDIRMPFMTHIIEGIHMAQSVRVRAYTGNENFESYCEKTVKENEEEGNDKYIYITKNGSKYHTNSKCNYINVKVKAKTYGEVKETKSICEVCSKQANSLNQLSVIYTTDKSDIFHTSLSCWTIKRDVNHVTLEEALQAGYTLCSKCKEVHE